MNQSMHIFIPAFFYSYGQGAQRQLCVQASIQIPSDTSPAEEVQDDCQIYEFSGQPYVGNIGSPDLIQSSYFQVFYQVGVCPEVMVGIGGLMP
jgi:hypothetical protein